MSSDFKSFDNFFNIKVWYRSDTNYSDVIFWHLKETSKEYGKWNIKMKTLSEDVCVCLTF
jgi:hypothetical protein